MLYSAACGAVSSTAIAGDDPTVRIVPIDDIANPQIASRLPGLPDRLRFFRNVIRRHTSHQKSREIYRSGFAIPSQVQGALCAGRSHDRGPVARNRRLIEAIRANDDPLGGVEDMLREFALSTKEGLALMVLAEALLRVPDSRTADRFIEDRLGQGDFVHHETRSSAFLVNASAWALGLSARVIKPGETPHRRCG